MLFAVKVEDIRKLVHEEPFRPFYMHVADGARLFVKHPDFIALSPGGDSVIVYIGDKAGEFEIVDTLSVTRLEPARNNGTPKPK